jgi:hypothetical protein
MWLLSFERVGANHTTRMIMSVRKDDKYLVFVVLLRFIALAPDSITIIINNITILSSICDAESAYN